MNEVFSIGLLEPADFARGVRLYLLSKHLEILYFFDLNCLSQFSDYLEGGELISASPFIMLGLYDEKETYSCVFFEVVDSALKVVSFGGAFPFCNEL